MGTPLRLKRAEDKPESLPRKQRPWYILIVDDDAEVHAVTRMILADLTFHHRPMKMESAYSATEARAMLQQRGDYAMVLLDVVMEHESAGLELVQFIRHDLDNKDVRIVLRTGQPGQAPELDVIMDYDINDYKTKTELTAQTLITTVITALRSYRDITAIHRVKQGIRQVLDSAENLFHARSMHQFASGVLEQLASFLDCEPDGILCVKHKGEAYACRTPQCTLRVMAAVGTYARCIHCHLGDACRHSEEAALLRQTFAGEDDTLGDKQVLYLDAGDGLEAAVLLNTPFKPDAGDQQLLQLFVSKIAIGLRNVYLYETLEQRVEIRTRELEASQHRLQGILNHMPAMCARLSPTLQIVWASRAVESILGYTELQIRDYHLNDLLMHKDDEAVLMQALREGKVHGLRCQVRRADGRPIWLSLSWHTVNEDGYVEAMIHDVTQEVVFEQQQREIAQRMAEMQHLDALGTMAGGLAHDFNNILTTIIGNAEVARMKVEHQPEVDALMATVLQSSDKASQLCQQMLAYAGKGRYWVSVLNINRMVTKQEAMFCRLAGGAGFLHYQLDQHLPCIRGDRAQLNQLLVNLISNAHEAYGEQAGPICLRTMHVTALPKQLTHNYFATGSASSIVAICIKDCAKGMEPEVVKQVFEPFFSTHFVGRGLGLSAVLGIVRSHHGAIYINSVQGKGTEVWVYFPEDGVETANVGS